LKLNLGCGRRHLPGYVNVDKQALCEPDEIADLEQLPWQWESDSIDEVVLTHVLEHLGQETAIFLGIMNELHRVLRPGGEAHIRVPHPRSDTFVADPTHVRPITPLGLSLFSQRLNREWAGKGASNTPLGFYLGIDFELVNTEYSLTQKWAIKRRNDEINDDELAFALDTYSNVAREIYMVLRKPEAS
jgi:SAM-dependent methyltransferase